MNPGKSFIACIAVAALAGCATLGSKTPVNSTGTKGDCGYRKANQCEVMISYDRLRGFTFAPEDLTVHFNPADPQPQPITWTFKPSRQRIAIIQTTTSSNTNQENVLGPSPRSSHS